MTDAAYRAFIKDELSKLKAYDALRPANHPYPFHQHVVRVAKSMKALALAMNMHPSRAEALYDASLLHDAGKRLLPVAIWDIEGKPDEKTKKLRRQHTTLGVTLVDDTFGADAHTPFLDLLRDLMAHHHEAMDGTGWLRMTGDQLSLEARMLCICDAFDGYSVWRPHYGHRDITPAAVLKRMAVEKTGQFDHDILDIFSKVKHAAV